MSSIGVPGWPGGKTTMLDDLNADDAPLAERRMVTPKPSPGAALAGGVLHILRRRFWLLALAGLLGIPLVLALSTLLTPRYNAHAELLVDPRDLRVLDNEVTPTMSQSDTGTALVESQVRVLGSDNVLRRVVEKLKLTEDPEFNGTPRGPLAQITVWLADVQAKFAAAETQAADPVETALQQLSRQTFVRRPERTFIAEITVGAETRAKAASITQAIIDGYLADLADARTKAATAAGASIEAQVQTLQKNVSDSEAKVARYKTENNLIGTGGVLVNEQQLSEVNNQLTQARAETSRAKTRFDELRSSLATPESSPEVVASATLRNLKAQLSTISAQRQQLATDLLPSHPSLRAITAQERTVRGQMKQEMSLIATSVQREYERDKAAETALATMLTDLRKLLVTTNTAQIGLRELERELEANRSIYQAAITRLREAKGQETINTANVRVISPAIADRDRISPPSRKVLLPIGFAGGFGLLWLALILAGMLRRPAAA